MKIAIGADHKGFSLKEKIKKCLENMDIEYSDFGTNSEESVDYPDYAKLVGENVRDKKSDFGILICQSGIGMSIAANKVKGIRAAYVINEEMAYASRHHNNANILVFGAIIMDNKDICSIIKIFLRETFDGERHLRRINKITKIEQG